MTDAHRHGSARPAPRAKGEIVKHLVESHGHAIPNPQHWTVAALTENHRIAHRDSATEGKEQA